MSDFDSIALLGRMRLEPKILFAGTDLQNLSDEVRRFDWNMILTANNDMTQSRLFSKTGRTFFDVDDADHLQGDLLNSKALHIVRLIPEKVDVKDPDELTDLMRDSIESDAGRILQTIATVIERNGIVLLEDFDDPIISHKLIWKEFRKLSPNHQIYFFNVLNPDQYLKDLDDKEIAVLISDSLNTVFADYFQDSDEEEYGEELDAVHDSHYYIGNEGGTRLHSISREYLSETENIVELLSVENVEQCIVPRDMMREYYYSFLKDSVLSPQWFGYKYGFSIKREFEDPLYDMVKAGLEKVAAGSLRSRPVLLEGATDTGKSVALGALAYRIFEEKQYPVLFISNADLNFRQINRGSGKREDSVPFMVLLRMIETLEKEGARAILVIWDSSSFSSGRQAVYNLLQALLSRGKKVFLLASAYEENGSASVENAKDGTYFLSDKRFEICRAKGNLTDEMQQLRGILRDRCLLPEEEVRSILNIKPKTEDTFLSLLYKIFGTAVRDNLAVGVEKEADLNLSEVKKLAELDVEEDEINPGFAAAFEKIRGSLQEAGYRVLDASERDRQAQEAHVKDFINSIALAGKYKLKVPYDFALRILDSYNSRIINVLSSSTFFVIDTDFEDNYFITIRSALEAKLYLRANRISAAGEIDIIIRMLENMKPTYTYGEGSEARLCEQLIILVGPNGIHDNKRAYREEYPRLIDALQDLREKRGVVEPLLVAQEVTYIREVYGKDTTLDTKSRIEWLKKAIDVTDRLLYTMSANHEQGGIVDSLTVERANSRILQLELEESTDLQAYNHLFDQLRAVAVNTGDLKQKGYAYVTLLKAEVTQYNLESDEKDRYRLLDAMCSTLDEIVFKDEAIEDSEVFQKQKLTIISLLDDSEVAESYVQSLVDQGYSSGLCLQVRKMIRDADIDFRERLNENQLACCRKAYYYLAQPEYKSLVMMNGSCLYLLLNLYWQITNKTPVFEEGEQWYTTMTPGQWKQIKAYVTAYLQAAKAEGTEPDKNMLYLLALCHAELEEYKDCVRTFNEMGDDYQRGVARLRIKHILCDENGDPVKFVGKIKTYDAQKKSGFIYVSDFDKTMYFYGASMGDAILKQDVQFMDVEIGFSNLGPRAFRGLKPGR